MRTVDRFHPPGGSPGGSRRGPERPFWGLFCGWVGGNEKKTQKVSTNAFLKAFFACVFLPLPCVFCSPRHSPAQKHNLKNCLKPLVFVVESAYAPFARAARQTFKPNESRTKYESKAIQKALCRGSFKQHQKSAVLRVKMPPKIDPGGWGEPPDRLPRATSAKTTFMFGSCPGPKALPRASLNLK